MAHLISNIPYFKCWVRKEFTNGHQNYHGEFIHGLAVAVTTMPDRCLSFQIIFTGCEADDGSQENVHGGAMWARMPITGLVGDIALEEWPERMETHLAQPWDCPSHNHSIVSLNRCKPSPWLCKIAGEFHQSRYLFTVDYTDTDVADDPAQHKQAHVMQLLGALDADDTEAVWTGNIVALPNNRVRVTHPAWFEMGEGAPDFKPSQHIHYSKSDLDYTLDVTKIFDNIYSEE